MSTVPEVAAHLDLSMDRVRQLQRAGILPRAAKGELDIDECRVLYIRNLRAGATGRGVAASEEGILDLSAERARLAKEQADGQAMKNDQLRASLLPRDEITAAVQAAFSRVRARLRAIPVKAAPIVVGLRYVAEVKALLSEAIDEALNELAATEIIPEVVTSVDDSRPANGHSGTGLVDSAQASADA